MHLMLYSYTLRNFYSVLFNICYIYSDRNTLKHLLPKCACVREEEENRDIRKQDII